VFTLGVNKGVNNTFRGQSSPLGVHFTPRGKLMLFKTGLRVTYAFIEEEKDK
jgi:hypothetical protein